MPPLKTLPSKGAQASTVQRPSAARLDRNKGSQRVCRTPPRFSALRNARSFPKPVNGARLPIIFGGESVLGPYVLGLELPVQIAPMTASASDLVMLAVLALELSGDLR